MLGDLEFTGYNRLAEGANNHAENSACRGDNITVMEYPAYCQDRQEKIVPGYQPVLGGGRVDVLCAYGTCRLYFSGSRMARIQYYEFYTIQRRPCYGTGVSEKVKWKNVMGI